MDPGTSIIRSALFIPVTVPVAVIRPAVEASAIVTARSGEFPAWKSTPPPEADIVSVFDDKSSFPRVRIRRWLVPERVRLVASATLPAVLSIVQLPFAGVPEDCAIVWLAVPVKLRVPVPPSAVLSIVILPRGSHAP